MYCSRSFLPGPLLLFDWMPVVVQLTWAHVISSFIQTIIQPFPNARRQLSGGKHREGVWPQAMVSRRLDTVEWSQGELLGVGRYDCPGARNIIGLYCRPICRPNVSRPIMPIGAQKSNFRLVICLTNTRLEPTACKNMYYYGAKLRPLCHMAQWKQSLIASSNNFQLKQYSHNKKLTKI